MNHALAAALLLSSPAIGVADGGRLVLNQTAGSFRVAVFTEPTPLRVGTIEVGVLVQEANDDTAVLDAEVTVGLALVPNGSPISARAERGKAQNQILYAARLEPSEPGSYELAVEVERGTEHQALAIDVPIEPRASPLLEAWPYLAIPPVAIALFALHQWLKRRSGRRGRAAS